jgi:hypothetical protein
MKRAPTSNQNSKPSPTPRSEGRRRLLRTGIAVPPVLLSVTSRPVLGDTLCSAVSVMGSGGSNVQKQASICHGLTPLQWKQLATQWPLPYCGVSQSYSTTGATLYHCPTTGFAGRIFGDHSMLDVIDMGEDSFSLRGLGRYMVAALLNACSGRTPVLDETGVRSMWNELVTQGYYEPVPGVQWQAPEVIAYIQTTMG